MNGSKNFTHKFEERKNLENPTVDIRETKDRPAKNFEFLKEALENEGDEQTHEDFFEEKYKENHGSEFKTPEGLTKDEVYDPTDELDKKIDRNFARKGYGLESITGPAPQDRGTKFIPKHVWDTLPSWKKKLINKERDETRGYKMRIFRPIKKLFAKGGKGIALNNKKKTPQEEKDTKAA